jgi:glyoxylase-like metal-dependent hydrolase (beta-lactamase superfamily II)
MGVKIKIIANSHAHVDHVLGVRGVQAATNARFLLHKADLELLQTGWKDTVKKFNLDVPEGPPDPDNYVTGGNVVEVEGLRLEAIETPGHTPGSMSYYTEGLLFSGDTLFKGSIGRTDLPGGNYEKEMRSINTILTKLPDETVVLPGHMAETTIAEEKANNPFFQDWKNKQESNN